MAFNATFADEPEFFRSLTAVFDQLVLRLTSV